MIRAALLLALALPAHAQTQGTYKAHDALRQCVAPGGALDGIADFQSALDRAAQFGWGVTGIGPDHYRLSRTRDPSFGVEIEVNLNDGAGSAYCIAYGPALQPGDAAAAADRAVAEGLMPPGTTRLDPSGTGYTRGYSAQNGALTVGLSAYQVNGAEIAGFTISGLGRVPDRLPFDEAVRQNLALGLRLCIEGEMPPEARAATFRSAGFAERLQKSDGNTMHHFTAPGETARVELSYGEMPSDCRVFTEHLGVTGAAAVLDWVVPQLAPNLVRIETLGEINPATGQPALCVRYEDPANPIGLVIGALPGNTNSACAETGASILYQSYRV